MPSFEVDGRAVSWKRTGALRGRPLILLAHGAGAPYTHPFMEAVAVGLAARGICVLRFHFPYMEQMVRTGTRRGPDPQARLIETWRAMLERASRMRGHGPLFVGGKSMGGRMASMLLASGGGPDVRGAVYLGYPLHPPGKPERLRADHLRDVPVPQLFVSGDRDELCRPELLRAVLKKLPNARHHEVAGGDHSLATSRRAPLEGADAWLDVVAAFVHELAARE